MEDVRSRARRTTATVFLIIAVGVWISWLSYIAEAIRHEAVPVTWHIFAGFLIGILFFLIPALLLFFPYRDRYSPYRFHVSLWLTITGLYWMFAPLYQYLSVNTNRDLVLWYMVPYAWEVPVLGYLYFAPVYHRFQRIREACARYRAGKRGSPDQLRHQIVALPLFAGWYFAIIAVLSYGPIGSLQFRLLGGAPWPEIIKNMVTGTAMGFMSGTLVFFLLHRILAPYLELIPPSRTQVPFPIGRKLGIITVTLVALAFLIYVPVAYRNAQALLAENVLVRTSDALRDCVLEGEGEALRDCSGYGVGPHGYFFTVDSFGRVVGEHPRGFRDLSDERLESVVVAGLLSGRPVALRSLRYQTRYLVSMPRGKRTIIAVAYESDFLRQLNFFLGSALVVGLSFGILFAILIILFTRGVADPIGRLTGAVRDLVAKKTPRPVQIGTGDEIALLAQEFSTMARELRSYERGLERKVAARTAELARVNKELGEKNSVLERVIQDVKKFDEELVRLNTAKSEFISMASHQLRTPLTAIKWYANALSREGLQAFSAKQRRALHEIADSNNRMINLVNSLLNVSRLEVGTLAIEPKPVRIGSFLRGLLTEVEPLAVAHRISLRKRLTRDITLRVDEHLLREAVLNLLSNAIRYTPKGGRVTLELDLKGKYVTVSVTDTGYGIPEKDKKLIFSKFYRASNVAAKDPQGTGLGLYITKSVIENMGGTVGFVSAEGAGSTFWIALPRRGVRARVGTRGLSPMRV